MCLPSSATFIKLDLQNKVKGKTCSPVPREFWCWTCRKGGPQTSRASGAASGTRTPAAWCWGTSSLKSAVWLASSEWGGHWSRTIGPCVALESLTSHCPRQEDSGDHGPLHGAGRLLARGRHHHHGAARRGRPSARQAAPAAPACIICIKKNWTMFLLFRLSMSCLEHISA